MANGPSEIILLIAGLIVAGLVSGVLLDTWGDMDSAIEDRGKEGAEDVRTRASLVNDPSNVGWDDTEKRATLSSRFFFREDNVMEDPSKEAEELILAANFRWAALIAPASRSRAPSLSISIVALARFGFCSLLTHEPA